MNRDAVDTILTERVTMKFYEYKAKEVFAKYNIPVPKGKLVKEGEELADFEFPAVVKAQVLVGGRGKAGGIRFANDLKEANQRIEEIVGMDIKGHRVRQVLVEKKLDVAKEFYLGFIVDRAERKSLLIGSAFGGMEIEDVPDKDLYRKHINPLIGLQQFMLRDLTYKLGLSKEQGSQVSKLVSNLYSLFVKEDAELAEINPLVLTKGGEFVAGDAKLTVDDDSLFRHPEYRGMEQDLTQLEKKAKEKDISFIQLDGDIGVIANGAGLTMATLDHLTQYGGKAGVFLDLGGTDNPEKVKEAFILMKEAKPSVILLNIFGGITKCDTVARGVAEALKSESITIPIAARIKGLNEEEAMQILRDAGLVAVATLEEAAKEAVRLRG